MDSVSGVLWRAPPRFPRNALYANTSFVFLIAEALRTKSILATETRRRKSSVDGQVKIRKRRKVSRIALFTRAVHSDTILLITTLASDPTVLHGFVIVDVSGDEEEGKEPAAAAIPSTAFPSLADAADAPEVPVSRGKSSSSTSGLSSARRPRFINSNAEKIRQKLAEQRAAGK